MDIEFEYLLHVLVSTNFEYMSRLLEKTNHPCSQEHGSSRKKEGKNEKEYFMGTLFSKLLSWYKN